MQKIIATIALLVLHAVAAGAASSAEILERLDKLSTVGSALYVAAHPDDENTAMLAWLEGDRRMRAGYLSMTRGDGGQNLIGDEKGAALGVIRTEELMAARNLDGAEQFFTRAIDFGYTKSPEETLAKWGHDEILADVVRVIRSFRPDIIITRFPTDGGGGHGQHTASALLALEAFHAAGDPSRFPEQLSTLQPWQPKRIYWNSWRPDLENRPAGAPPLLAVDLGSFNPVSGQSYTEIAARSRSMHKSQGFGAPERRGTLINYLEPLDGSRPTSPFDGVDLGWSRIEGGDRVGRLIERARSEFDPARPSKIVPTLLEALRLLRDLPVDVWTAQKRDELIETIRLASGIWIEARTSAATAVPGEEIEVELTAVNRSDLPWTLEYIWLPGDRKLEGFESQPLPNNVPVTRKVTIRIPDDASVSHPYWLRAEPDGERFHVEQPHLIGKPVNPPVLPFRLLLGGAGAATIELETAAVWRYTDRVRGDVYEPFAVVPPVTLNFELPVYVFPDPKPRAVRAWIRSGTDAVEGTVTFALPDGWTASPASHRFSLARKGETAVVEMMVRPPSSPSEGIIEARSKGEPMLGMATIDYEHIPKQALYPMASAKLVRAEIAHRGATIGYVRGSGDEIPDALRQIGYEVIDIDPERIASTDLSKFDTIVTGIRAYNTSPRLVLEQPRLLRWVENGGTLVVQYNTIERELQNAIGPWPLEISRDRITVEESPVTLLRPDHPLLTTPNRITADDFRGWVQERGLYFPGKRDPRYEAIISSFDPGEEPLDSAILHARHGKGVFIYTGISFFRQLPAGVPGAYRLFANLVSARGER